MSLQQLHLPAEILAELYTNHLVESKDTASKKNDKKKELPTALPSLGGNAKRIAILIGDESQTFMKDDDLEWLQKMLQACKLSLGDVAIVNTRSKKFSMALLREQLMPLKILMLGPSPSELELPLNFPQFKLQEHDQCVYLFSPSPKDLNQETNDGKILRTKLWVSLKDLFDV